MRYPKADTVNKRIVENERLSQKARLRALAALTRPSLWLLTRLLNNPTTPSRIVTLAAKRYEVEILKRDLRYARPRSPQTTPTDN
jgi:hypothetical protein